MKKILQLTLVFLFLGIFTKAWAISFELEGGLEYANINYDSKYENKGNFSPYINFYVPIANFSTTNYLDVGFGVSYLGFQYKDEALYKRQNIQNLGNITEDDVTKKNSVPVYLTIKYTNVLSKDWFFYISGKAGISSGVKRYYYNYDAQEDIKTQGYIYNQYVYGINSGVRYNNIGMGISYVGITSKNKLTVTSTNTNNEIKTDNINYVGINIFYLFSYVGKSSDR